MGHGNGRKILSLEGVRGLASLTVVLEHYLIAFFSLVMIDAVVNTNDLPMVSQITFTPVNLTYNGNAAVAVFFVLSGFVLTRSFFEQDRVFSVGDLIAKSIQRYMRLSLPVLGSVILIYLIFVIDGFYFGSLVHFTQSINPDYYAEPLSFSEIFSYAFIDVMIKGEYGYNPPFWTMQKELVGSLVVFFIMATVGRMPQLVRYLVYLALCVVFFGSYYWAFVAGMALADLLSSEKCFTVIKKLSGKWLFAFMLVSVYLLGFTMRGHDSNMYAVFFSAGAIPEMESQIHIAGAILFVFSVLMSQHAKKIMESTPMIFLGGMSFSVYLTHYIVLASVSSYVFLWMAEKYTVFESFFVAFGCVGLPLTIIIALVFNVIDRQSIVQSKKVGTILKQISQKHKGSFERVLTHE